jgi:hypothetical protein
LLTRGDVPKCCCAIFYMTQSFQSARKRDGHERTIRNVVDFAHEVRVLLHDEQVIFGSVGSVPKGDRGSFLIRPWGVASAMAIQFDDVAVATSVKQMGWDRHRAIAAAQGAGVFACARKPARKAPTSILT